MTQRRTVIWVLGFMHCSAVVFWVVVTCLCSVLLCIRHRACAGVRAVGVRCSQLVADVDARRLVCTCCATFKFLCCLRLSRAGCCMGRVCPDSLSQAPGSCQAQWITGEWVDQGHSWAAGRGHAHYDVTVPDCVVSVLLTASGIWGRAFSKAVVQ